MAYEPSEGLFAGLALIDKTTITAASSNQSKFQELMSLAVSKLAGDQVLDAAGNTTKNGMLKAVDLEGKTTDKIKAIYSDLAAASSAVLGARGSKGVPDKVYLTGNKWHTDVEAFKLKHVGMADYNSSDVILKYGKTYVGVSLKKKPKSAAPSPTLINNAFSAYIKADGLEGAKQKIQKHRVRWFANVIKEACTKGGPLYGFASSPSMKSRGLSTLNPMTSDADAEILWNMKVVRKKPDGKTENIFLINLKSDQDLADADGLIKKTTSKGKQDEFRKYVNEKLQSKGGTLNGLYQGFLDIMNEAKVKETLADTMLNRVLKLEMYDEFPLELWKNKEFEFLLCEGVGSVDNDLIPSVQTANTATLSSIMIAIIRLKKEPTTITLNTEDTFRRNAAKVFFTLSKGKTPVLDIELRYKGDFAAYPQFFAGMTKEFKALVKQPL
tara:strand:- start:1467 stop:2786 length:1320 start_codon:yes stop_codon:yes gene_type:complete